VKPHKIYLCARVQEMAAAEVQALIGEARYQAIKSQDPHPFFVAFSAGHEGESRGQVLNGVAGFKPVSSGTRKLWSRSRIRELALRLAEKPVYLFHNADNSPRTRIGEIVATLARRLKGRLHALGVAYIRDLEARERIRAGELDTCSIEAELEFSREPKAESWLVEAVRKVTGLALGSRATASPGFPGASLLAVVQEFEPEEREEEEARHRFEQEIQSREERIHQLEEEIARLKSPREPSQLSGSVESLVVERVREELRRLYPESEKFPAPPEPVGGSRGHAEPWQTNPLIPRE